jgi:hypothetical protein
MSNLDIYIKKPLRRLVARNKQKAQSSQDFYREKGFLKGVDSPALLCEAMTYNFLATASRT